MPLVAAPNPGLRLGFSAHGRRHTELVSTAWPTPYVSHGQGRPAPWGNVISVRQMSALTERVRGWHKSALSGILLGSAQRYGLLTR